MAIQQALAAKGFSPGNIDGVWGRRTDTAVKAFQRANNLQPDGVVGPVTSAALFGQAPAVDPLDDVAIIWFQEARRLLGVREDTSPGSNPVLLQWADDAGIPYKSDDIAWCGLFVAHCISSTLNTEPLPGNPLSAQSWRRFGAPCTVRPGAVMVFWREKPTSWKGHVGFYAGEDDVAYHILGGNQSDKVSVARVRKDRILPDGIRWPATVPLSNAGPVKVAATGGLSRYEA
ncbi:hypothetical protein ABAC460_03785 [Asticcacaulis sp. AC460]|nr:hypothetical protein ABAC460_03785 [Asticcacaulis sp. AC460]